MKPEIAFTSSFILVSITFLSGCTGTSAGRPSTRVATRTTAEVPTEGTATDHQPDADQEGAVTVRAVAPTLPGGIKLGTFLKGTLAVDNDAVSFRCSKQDVEIPYSRLVSAKTRVEDDKRLWFFTYTPVKGAKEQIFSVMCQEEGAPTDAIINVITGVTGFEAHDESGGIEYRTPVPRDPESIAAATKSEWSEFDRRIVSTSPEFVVLKPSIEDRRSVNVSLTMVHDDDIEVGRISLIYVGDGWLWLSQEITASLPGDEEMVFQRTHSDVPGGSTCVEVMTTTLDRAAFREFAKTGFAMECPHLGIVRVPAHYFGGLMMAFDNAKADHGIEVFPSASVDAEH